MSKELDTQKTSLLFKTWSDAVSTETRFKTDSDEIKDAGFETATVNCLLVQFS